MFSSNIQQTKPEIMTTMTRSKGADRIEALAWCLANMDWTPVYEAKDIDAKVN